MTISLNKIESMLFTLVMVFFIFNIKFKGLPPSFLIASMFLAIMAFYYFLKNYPIPKEIFKPIAFLFLFIFSVLLSILVNGNVDYFLFGIILSVLFIISIAPYALLSHFKGREIEIIKFIVYAGLINAIFLIGMFLFSDFKLFYISLLSKIDLLDVKGQDAIDSLYSMRLIGLTGSATYGMAVTQIIIAMVYVFYVHKIKRGFRFYNYLVLFLLILSAVISGRTAFLGLFFVFLLIFILNKKTEVVKFVFLLLFAFFCFFTLAKYFLPENFYSFFESWIYQLFSKSQSLGSLDENINMLTYFKLSDFSFFGDLKWHADELRNSYYMGTDIGWYRFAFAFGFAGLYFFILYLFSFVRFSLKINAANLTILFINVFLLVVMFKGAILFDFYMIYFILVIVCFFSNNRWSDDAV
jgi:hypothetical protein